MSTVMHGLKRFRDNPSFPSLVVLLLVIVANAVLQPDFFSLGVIQSNLMTLAPMVLASCAQAVVIFVGGIDLSIGSAVGLINVIMALMMQDSGSSIASAMLAGLGVSLGIGLLNGCSIALLRLPPIIATFGTASILYGLALMLMPQPGGYVPEGFTEFYQQMWFGWLPVPLVILGVAACIWMGLRARPLHRYIYAVGGAEDGAFANGIPVSRVKIWTFVVSGVFIYMTACVVTAQTASGAADIGQSYTLTSIAAAVIGGASLQGGRGNLLGAAFGAAILTLVMNIIFFANISSMYQDLIRGAMIIAALGTALIPKLKQRMLIAVRE
ncbi:MAG: ABC transporter permease [Alicyclobacillus sp.]|nr:ABC transporter permease [Alicyclobacillus sp.]